MQHGGWGSHGIRLLAVLCVLAMPACSRNTAQSWFDRGADKFHDGNYDEAIDAYTHGLALEPDSPVGHNLLGMAYRMKFNGTGVSMWKEKEIASFRRAVEADSTYWPAYINLGASLYYIGKKTEAAPYFARALEVHPDNPERAQLEAFIREGGGEVPKAPASQ